MHYEDWRRTKTPDDVNVALKKAVAKERERCAKVAEQWRGGKEIAADIRSGKKFKKHKPHPTLQHADTPWG